MSELRRQLFPRVVVLTGITSIVIVSANFVQPGTF